MYSETNWGACPTCSKELDDIYCVKCIPGVRQARYADAVMYLDLMKECVQDLVNVIGKTNITKQLFLNIQLVRDNVYALNHVLYIAEERLVDNYVSIKYGEGK